MALFAHNVPVSGTLLTLSDKVCDNTDKEASLRCGGTYLQKLPFATLTSSLPHMIPGAARTRRYSLANTQVTLLGFRYRLMAIVIAAR